MTTEQEKEYQAFLEQKKQTRVESGFEVSESDLNPSLFPFQKYCVLRALAAGKFALFEDCGLGKTIQQLEWSQKVCDHIDRPVLILAPLAVISQTIKEGEKFGYRVTELAETEFGQDLDTGIYITNYDNMEHIEAYHFGGVVLDAFNYTVLYTTFSGVALLGLVICLLFVPKL